jgi:cobalt-zinc-cadmium efflux system outer membrane protein
MPLPLWDRNVAAIAEARAERLAAELDAESAARGLAAERERAAAQWEAARIEVDALVTTGLPSAQTAARLAAQGYEGGRLSLLERLEAERALSDVRERLETARLELRRAEAVLESLR